MKKWKGITYTLAVYVDDILITGNETKVENIKILIKRKFKIKNIGD